jgi:hypothetical protein
MRELIASHLRDEVTLEALSVDRLRATLAVARRRRGTAEEGGQQDEIHLPWLGRNAWAKPGSALICGECYDDGKGEIRIIASR